MYPNQLHNLIQPISTLKVDFFTEYIIDDSLSENIEQVYEIVKNKISINIPKEYYSSNNYLNSIISQLPQANLAYNEENNFIIAYKEETLDNILYMLDFSFLTKIKEKHPYYYYKIGELLYNANQTEELIDLHFYYSYEEKLSENKGSKKLSTKERINKILIDYNNRFIKQFESSTNITKTFNSELENILLNVQVISSLFVNDSETNKYIHNDIYGKEADDFYTYSQNIKINFHHQLYESLIKLYGNEIDEAYFSGVSPAPIYSYEIIYQDSDIPHKIEEIKISEILLQLINQIDILDGKYIS